MSTFVNGRPQVMISTIPRSNFDVCRWKSFDSSSSVDLESIYCRCEMRTGLTRIAMKRYDASFDMSCAVMLKDIAGCRVW